MSATAKAKPAAAVPPPERVVERVRSLFDGRDPDECWLWPKSIASTGYGQVGWWHEGRSVMTTAHRVAWMAANGPIPEGLTVDHVCRVRACINPGHLRLLSNVENARDNRQAQRGRGRVSYKQEVR